MKPEVLDSSYVMMKCLAHGIIHEIANINLVEIYEREHRKEYGCYYDIEIYPTELPIQKEMREKLAEGKNKPTLIGNSRI